MYGAQAGMRASRFVGVRATRRRLAVALLPTRASELCCVRGRLTRVEARVAMICVCLVRVLEIRSDTFVTRNHETNDASNE